MYKNVPAMGNQSTVVSDIGTAFHKCAPGS